MVNSLLHSNLTCSDVVKSFAACGSLNGLKRYSSSVLKNLCLTQACWDVKRGRVSQAGREKMVYCKWFMEVSWSVAEA